MTAFVIQALVALVVGPFVLMQAIFCLEIVCGLRRSKRILEASTAVDTCILIPAHNEAAVIGNTLECIIRNQGEQARILVVADNCEDDTARIAKDFGVEVIERLNPEKRGKGYALAFGIDYLSVSPPDVLVVVDADCRPEARAISVLARSAMTHQRPVQGCYLIEVVSESGPKTRISAFAFLVKNQVRQNGMSKIADTCVLTGSGMAFLWQQIKKVDLANDEAVEDLVLGLKLALAGHYPRFEPNAVILSDAAPSDAETTKQRQRWETGFMTIAAQFAPKLFLHAARTGSFRALWLALHLAVPPFMLLLVAGWGCALLIGLLGKFHFIGNAVQGGASASAATATALVGVAWWRFGRKIVKFEDFLVIPVYTCSKVANVFSAVAGKNRSWNKTKR